MKDDIVDTMRRIERIGMPSILTDAADEIERLRGELFPIRKELEEARAERNAARAEVCYLRPSVALGAQTAAEYAASRGWVLLFDSEADEPESVQDSRQFIAEEIGPDATVWDDLDEAIVGYVTRQGMESAVAYDYGIVLRIMCREMTLEEAREYIDFNIMGAYVGPRTPVMLHRKD